MVGVGFRTWCDRGSIRGSPVGLTGKKCAVITWGIQGLEVSAGGLWQLSQVWWNSGGQTGSSQTSLEVAITPSGVPDSSFRVELRGKCMILGRAGVE